MGTKQFNDKTIHRQQVKTGFAQKGENRSPGLFQDFFIFQGLNIFPIFYNTTFKSGLFSARSGEMKGALDFFDSDNNNNLTPVIKTGTTAPLE